MVEMVEKMIIMMHLCTIAMFCTKSVISVKIKDCISAEEGDISTKAFEHALSLSFWSNAKEIFTNREE